MKIPNEFFCTFHIPKTQIIKCLFIRGGRRLTVVHALFDKAPWESIDITSHIACNKFACFIFFSNESGLKNSYFHYWISGISRPEMNPFGAEMPEHWPDDRGKIPLKPDLLVQRTASKVWFILKKTQLPEHWTDDGQERFHLNLFEILWESIFGLNSKW